jgi:hypothetical protein
LVFTITENYKINLESLRTKHGKMI